MQKKRSYVGPRGWAMLVLVSGAAFASPFLRAPRVDVADAVSESPLAHQQRPNAKWSEVSFSRHAATEGASGMALPADGSGLATDAPRGESRPQLPAWAPPRSRLDELISMGAAPPWEDDAPANDLPPLQPWMNRQLETNDRPSTQAGLPRDARPLASATPTSPFDAAWEGGQAMKVSPSGLAENSSRSWPTFVPDSTARPPLGKPATTPAALARPASTDSHASLSASSAERPLPESAATNDSPRERRFVFQPGMSRP